MQNKKQAAIIKTSEYCGLEALDHPQSNQVYYEPTCIIVLKYSIPVNPKYLDSNEDVNTT